MSDEQQNKETTTEDESVQAVEVEPQATTTTPKEIDPDQLFALVIEDDPDASFIYQRAMEANDYHVQVINRGDDAQDALKTLRPDVILLDLHLPVVGGVELLRQIRDNDEMQDTRVILLTADHATADMIEASADMVLLKPATYSQVRDLVKRIMKGSGRG